ncbi:hypothetical protein MN608_02049 [Microdochium nivale]|nr:hypothetical protein MN608_02049 [Microdochium nivale]
MSVTRRSRGGGHKERDSPPTTINHSCPVFCGHHLGKSRQKEPSTRVTIWTTSPHSAELQAHRYLVRTEHCKADFATSTVGPGAADDHLALLLQSSE